MLKASSLQPSTVLRVLQALQKLGSSSTASPGNAGSSSSGRYASGSLQGDHLQPSTSSASSSSASAAGGGHPHREHLQLFRALALGVHQRLDECALPLLLRLTGTCLGMGLHHGLLFKGVAERCVGGGGLAWALLAPSRTVCAV